MEAQRKLRRAAPWLLCAVALGLLVLGTVLRSVVLGPSTSLNHEAWPAASIEALGFAGIPLVGAVIASRLPANPYGWIWCALGLAAGVAAAGGPLVEVLHGPPWVGEALGSWAFLSLVTLFVFVFLLFPTGRLPSSRWRWPARAAVAGCVLLSPAVPLVANPDKPGTASPWAVEGAAAEVLGGIGEGGVIALFGLVLVAMSSLVPRFLRAGPVERRQLTWFLYATAVNAAVLVLDALGLVTEGLLYATVSAAAFALLPVAVGIAVLRYRLFEIDRIVSRTVSYGLLSALLVGLYLLAVALLRPLLEPLTGSSTMAVAGSTLAVAAAFNPARRRLQAAVDRRFDRARYDAERAVAAFATRLRSQVDLDEISAGLRDTVTTTVAPSSVGVWFGGPSGLRQVRS